MLQTQSTPLLRRALLADAAFSAAAGALLALDAGILAPLLELPPSLLRYGGIVLLPWATAVAFAATRRALPAAAVWTIIAVNALWALDSALLLLSGWITPNALGIAFVVAQAVAVALFGEVQFMGLRCARRDAAEPVGA